MWPGKDIEDSGLESVRVESVHNSSLDESGCWNMEVQLLSAPQDLFLHTFCDASREVGMVERQFATVAGSKPDGSTKAWPCLKRPLVG